ncbi:membrane hypothetical protein [Vibrio nigripulchritudo SO65]|uniref:DUF805 domain-containing protein n=3 Tax=Vibrio nigripulchritudo TaxID=28173 RepID=UPI0003B1B03D|nr:DUF805 domain-containing protein [Vibrio nigripulchritudo]CCN42154.1 membrane hypothetical protein [Vibrio nigripulchritudo FTn2]CCN62699.1 membrane hypothetical protein [Vibrio nigripulchritudo POn4]CCN75532.1 membrane hypothetical protein [Vibrio nigripulchritudo SO65]
MKCSSCFGAFPREQVKVVETSNYCATCYQKLFAPTRKKISEKLVEKIEKSESQKIKTPRNGRVEYILNYFLSWCILPIFMAIAIPSSSSLSLVSNSGVTGYKVASNLNFSPSFLWLIPVLLSALYTSARVKDLEWKNKLSFLLWLPGINFILFFIPGTNGKNKYGLQPAKPTKFKALLAIILAVVMMLVVGSFISLIGYAGLNVT